MPAIKSGATPLTGTITISGTGNTITSIASDINDTAWAELVGGVLTIKCRYINISSDGELIIGSPNDFSVQEELRHLFVGVNAYNRLYVYEGGSFKMYGDTKCILNYNCTSAQYPDYCNFYGNVHIEGDDTYQPTLKGGRRFYFYTQSLNQTYADTSELTLLNCKIGEVHQNNNYFLAYNYIWNTFQVKNVTYVNNLYTGLQYFLGMIETGFKILKSLLVFENIKVDASALNFNLSYGGNYHLKNCDITTFGATANNYQLYNFNHFIGVDKPTYWLSSHQFMNPHYGQIYRLILENVKYVNNYSVNSYTYQNARVLVKDSSYPPSYVKPNLIYTGGELSCWNSDDWYSYVNLDNLASLAKKVFRLQLTVTDMQGNPIEGAVVTVNQKDGFEEFVFITEADGKPQCHTAVDGILLTNRAKATFAKTETIWSDSSNSSYHTVTVLKDGYKSETFNVIMDADKSQTVRLKKIQPVSLTLKGNLVVNS